MSFASCGGGSFIEECGIPASPKLDPKAEAAMRGALSEIKILSGKRAAMSSAR